jgi:hypothetical protein
MRSNKILMAIVIYGAASYFLDFGKIANKIDFVNRDAY